MGCKWGKNLWISLWNRSLNSDYWSTDLLEGWKKSHSHRAGALYDMGAPSWLVTLPDVQLNSYHITSNQKVNEVIVKHNGVEINRFPLHGSEWDKMVSESKFAKW